MTTVAERATPALPGWACWCNAMNPEELQKKAPDHRGNECHLCACGLWVPTGTYPAHLVDQHSIPAPDTQTTEPAACPGVCHKTTFPDQACEARCCSACSRHVISSPSHGF